jgi:Zn-dependent protease with chaperone function
VLNGCALNRPERVTLSARLEPVCFRFFFEVAVSPANRFLWMPLLAAAVVLGGCAAAPPATPAHGVHTTVSGWPLASLTGATGARTLLSAEKERPVAVVWTRSLKAAAAAVQRVLAVMPLKDAPVILITEGAVPNAFLFFDGEKPHVAANIGMLSMLDDDEGAWAALFGHELAHYTQRHRAVRAERQEVSDTASGLLGAALALAGVPFGSLIADSAATLVERGYTRDDERAADRLGVQAMVRAGYDPAGAVRLQEKLAAAGGDKPLPFLSTHPSGLERVEAMRALAREIGRPAPDAGVPPPPSEERKTPAVN